MVSGSFQQPPIDPVDESRQQSPGKSGRAAPKAAFTDPEKIRPSGPVWRFRIPRRSLQHPSQTSPPMRTLMSEWTPIAPLLVTAHHGKRQPIFRGETTANLLIKPARTIKRNANFYSTNLSSCGIRYTRCSAPRQRVPLAPAMQFIGGTPYRGPLRAASPA